jgi:hypothetical protein
MPSFFVAIWSVDTCSQTPGSWLLKDFRAKIGGLKLAVEAFSRARLVHGQGSMGSTPTNTVRAIFAAPEYLFAGVKDDEFHDRDFVSSSERRLFKDLIPRPVDTLLVPGSVAHRKDMGVGTARRDKYAAGVKTLPPALSDKHLEAINTRSQFVRNTAYAFFHGEKKMACHKQSDATDGRGESDREAFVPGFSSNKVNLPVAPGVGSAPAQQLRFGIEICADATKERGGTGYFDRAGPAAVDVKILVSAVLPSVSVYKDNVTQCIIHACSDASQSGVELINGGFSNLCATQSLKEGKLDFYQVTLP